jgi:AcrR family transcriptional regulator
MSLNPEKLRHVEPKHASHKSPRKRAARRTQAERSAETRQRILGASATLIRSRGYARLRTADVADAAGVSRGAMLHHFRTKGLLVVATLEHVFDEARTQSRERAAVSSPPGDLLAAVVSDAREFFFNEHFKVALDIVLSTSTDRAVRKQILDVSRKARRPVEAAWSAALAGRGVPPELASDIVAITLGLVRGMAIRTLWDDDPDWFEHLFALWRRMAEVYISSLKAKQKGRA